MREAVTYTIQCWVRSVPATLTSPSTRPWRVYVVVVSVVVVRTWSLQVTCTLWPSMVTSASLGWFAWSRLTVTVADRYPLPLVKPMALPSGPVALTRVPIVYE